MAVMAGAIVALLCVAAWRDLTTRTIPDAVSLGIVAAGLAARLPDGWSAAGASLATCGILILVLLPLCILGMFGGGDLKLLAALALGLSPAASFHMICAVAFAGGGLALVYLLLRQVAKRLTFRAAQRRHRHGAAWRIAAVEVWRIRRHAPLPYGIAVAVGAIVVLAGQPGV